MMRGLGIVKERPPDVRKVPSVLESNYVGELSEASMPDPREGKQSAFKTCFAWVSVDGNV